MRIGEAPCSLKRGIQLPASPFCVFAPKGTEDVPDEADAPSLHARMRALHFMIQA